MLLSTRIDELRLIVLNEIGFVPLRARESSLSTRRFHHVAMITSARQNIRIVERTKAIDDAVIHIELIKVRSPQRLGPTVAAQERANLLSNARIRARRGDDDHFVSALMQMMRISCDNARSTSGAGEGKHEGDAKKFPRRRRQRGEVKAYGIDSLTRLCQARCHALSFGVLGSMPSQTKSHGFIGRLCERGFELFGRFVPVVSLRRLIKPLDTAPLCVR